MNKPGSRSFHVKRSLDTWIACHQQTLFQFPDELEVPLEEVGGHSVGPTQKE